MEAEVKTTKSDNTIQTEIEEEGTWEFTEEFKKKNENTIQVVKQGLIEFNIVDMDGKDTGEKLVFDLGDIELPIKWQELVEQDKLNRANLKNKFLVIDKKQDHKGKKLLSSNEEEKIKALSEFLKKEAEVYNMFLGENGVEKLLYGRKLGYGTLSEINQIVMDVIVPKLDLSLKRTIENVKNKYSNVEEKEDNILE